MTQIHASSVVESGARLGRDVAIGPFCHVGPDVELGDGVVLHSHVVVAGHTKIGPRTKIFPFASIGHAPQDLKYRGEVSKLHVGGDCTIREGVTMNPGTASGGLLTSTGDRCTFLANAHVAHDCRIGNDVILVNNVMLAGHCQIGDFAILGGGSALHQFVRVGAHAMIGGLAGVENDVIPYGMALGNRASLAGLNLVGMKRRAFAREAIAYWTAAGAKHPGAVESSASNGHRTASQVRPRGRSAAPRRRSAETPTEGGGGRGPVQGKRGPKARAKPAGRA